MPDILFDNFTRWTELKTHLKQDKSLYTLIQQFWQAYSQNNSIPSEMHEPIVGSNRRIYRIGNQQERSIVLKNIPLVLAMKVPAHRMPDYPSYYEDEQELSDRKYKWINNEAQGFEALARTGEKHIPQVTGIIAGYGMLGILTEDITSGGIHIVEHNTTGRPHVKLRRTNEEPIDVTIDLKIAMFSAAYRTGHEADYMLERLQIDLPFHQ